MNSVPQFLAANPSIKTSRLGRERVGSPLVISRTS